MILRAARIVIAELSTTRRSSFGDTGLSLLLDRRAALPASVNCLLDSSAGGMKNSASLIPNIDWSIGHAKLQTARKPSVDRNLMELVSVRLSSGQQCSTACPRWIPWIRRHSVHICELVAIVVDKDLSFVRTVVSKVSRLEPSSRLASGREP